MKETKELIKQGNFKELFKDYKANGTVREEIDEFRAGYYNYRRRGHDGCDCCGGDCLQTLGGLVCLDTLCELGGGDLCACF